MPIQEHLRPKETVPDDKRTEGKDNAFQAMRVSPRNKPGSYSFDGGRLGSA